MIFCLAQHILNSQLIHGTSKERFVPPVYLCVLFNSYCFCFPYLNQVISSGIHKSASLIKSPVRYHKWSFEEERAVVEFVGLVKMDPEYGILESTQWPAFKAHHPFWKNCARHIQASTQSSVLLTSKKYCSVGFKSVLCQYDNMKGLHKLIHSFKIKVDCI